MKRIVDVDKSYKANAAKAIEKFFKAHPELAFDWREQFDWMAETHTEHFDDTVMADGTRNSDWSYSLWLVEDEDTTYIAVIIRE